MRLKDKAAIVTGGGRGIGRDIALAYAREGATVVVCDIDPDTARATANDIVNAGGTSSALAADIAKVRIGIAGPASFASLMTFAMRCGIGNSCAPSPIGRMFRDGSPDELVHGLSRGWAAHPPRSVPGLHIFPFGGVAKSGEWLTEMQRSWTASAVPHGG